MTRRQFVAAAAGAVSGPAGLSARRAARYLWSRQSADGGWRSETYGVLRSGQSLTPFVLEALLRLPDPPADAVERAVRFIERRIDPEGALGRANPLLSDYPNYATALAVLALTRLGQDAAPLAGYLRDRQFSERHGWTPDHPAYGAWGMGGDVRTPPDPGHVDLSMTRWVLQALAAAGTRPGDPAFARARVFLDRCRHADGGFHFSTVVQDANKAGRGRSGFLAYGSATAEGILALRAIGEEAAAPQRWLVRHHRSDRVPGFPESRRRFALGLRFYYAAAVREAAPALAVAPLLGFQRPDGSFANAEPLVKEDDPLIATAFAVRALAGR